MAWSAGFVAAVAAAAVAPVRLHVKLDTGLGRLGTRDLAEALRVAERISGAGSALELGGVMTHLATADEDLEFVACQLGIFQTLVAEMRTRWPSIAVHAANSAATLREPASHFDFVRCGIAIYGCDPMNVDPVSHGLEPALRADLVRRRYQTSASPRKRRLRSPVYRG